MKPYFKDNLATLYCGDARCMKELPDESVQMVCCSPPYWGLRKYADLPDLIWGGDEKCEHRWVDHAEFHGAPVYKGKTRWQHAEGDSPAKTPEIYETGAAGQERATHTNICSLCGAWKGSYGLEPTPEMYIEHTLEFLREIRQVLRKDGVVFLNLGDSYWGGKAHKAGETNPGKEYYTKDTDNFGTVDKTRHNILKPKDLCLIPFRVAIAAQEDGWWVRSVIVWSKPNPMPESVTDRPTESHEYILMLTKSKKYYWDAEAVREPLPESSIRRYEHAVNTNEQFDPSRHKHTDGVQSPMEVLTRAAANVLASGGRNIRSVWEFPTQPYPEAHFAVFPEKLPETCIKAATPEAGCCSKCGAPYERVIEKKPMKIRRTDWGDKAGNRTASSGTMLEPNETKTVGWQPTCNCNADKVPSLVLDPFAGSGTTLWEAKKLGRRAVGYELSEEYCKLALERNRQAVMELNL